MVTKKLTQLILFLVALAILGGVVAYVFQINFKNLGVQLLYHVIIGLAGVLAWKTAGFVDSTKALNEERPEVLPQELPKEFIGETLFVYNHLGNVAEIIPVSLIDRLSDNKGEKFYIPESFGRLEPHKTYDLLQKENGELYVQQVAVML